MASIASDIQLVRYKHNRTTFEVMVCDGAVTKYRDGEIEDIDKVVRADEVWIDAHRGERASKSQLEEAFGTQDVQEALKYILKNGDAQISENERQKQYEERRESLVTYIQKHYVNSHNNMPLEKERIESILDELNPKIDVKMDTPHLASKIVPKLIDKLAMKEGGTIIIGSITVPNEYAAAVSSAVRKFASVIKETLLEKDIKIEVAVKNHNMLVKELASVTGGNYYLEVVNQELVDRDARKNLESLEGNAGK